jgi:5-methylcytosine-specific restriction enzyme A
MTGSTRRTRSLPPQPEGRGPNGRPFCRWCGEEVAAGRRTFCSEECVSEYSIRSNPSYARQMVFRRDQGVCALCGTDTEAVQERLVKSWAATRNGGDQPAQAAFVAMVEQLRQQGYTVNRWYPHRSLWQMDHIVPVVEGGGACGLENLRTLCTPCHKRVTRELAARRAAEKRGDDPATAPVKRSKRTGQLPLLIGERE